MSEDPDPALPRRTRAERRQESRLRLHRALAELICEQGYAHTTAAQIGERAGYSRNMVRSSFGSKLDLLIDFAAQAAVLADEDAPLPSTATGLDQTLETIDRVIRFAELDGLSLRASYIVMFETVAGNDPLALLARAGHAPRTESRVRALIDGTLDGSIRSDIDASAEAELLRAEAMGIAFEEIQGLADMDLVDRLTLWREHVRARLAAPTRHPGEHEAARS